MPKPESRTAQDGLAWILAKVRPVPEEWLGGARAGATRRELEPEECTSWATLTDAWRRAMRWTDDLDVALSVMLAVALSTEQQGDQQLFLQVLAAAGSAKTRLADAMLVSRNCKALEHLTGFHSGYDDGSGEDFSLLARINKKTLITPEGDVLMQNPRFLELMSQQRRIFDGTSQASYKNKKEEQKHEGLRTPWIICGTPALLNVNQASLGDRFLRVIVDPPSLDVRREILHKVGMAALNTVTVRSNCDPSSIIESKLLTAYRLTGGYVDYLRSRSSELICGVGLDEEAVVGRCATLAEFAADMRARPDHLALKRGVGERHDAKELPTRLTFQFARLARCLAAAMGRAEVDAEVMRRVTKVALDTSRGHSLSMCRRLWKRAKEGQGGLCSTGMGQVVGESEERAHQLCRFLMRMDVLGQTDDKPKRWCLTERVMELCREVL